MCTAPIGHLARQPVPLRARLILSKSCGAALDAGPTRHVAAEPNHARRLPGGRGRRESKQKKAPAWAIEPARSIIQPGQVFHSAVPGACWREFPPLLLLYGWRYTFSAATTVVVTALHFQGYSGAFRRPFQFLLHSRYIRAASRTSARLISAAPGTTRVNRESLQVNGYLLRPCAGTSGTDALIPTLRIQAGNANPRQPFAPRSCVGRP